MVNRDPEEARESHTWCHLVRAPAYPPWLQAPYRTNRTYFLLSLFSIEFVESRYYWIFSTQTSKVFWLETCYQKNFSCDNWSANTVIIKQWESVTIQIFIRRGIKITAEASLCVSYMQKAGDSWDISPQIFLDFPQNFRLRTRNQYLVHPSHRLR